MPEAPTHPDTGPPTSGAAGATPATARAGWQRTSRWHKVVAVLGLAVVLGVGDRMSNVIFGSGFGPVGEGVSTIIFGGGGARGGGSGSGSGGGGSGGHAPGPPRGGHVPGPASGGR